MLTHNHKTLLEQILARQKALALETVKQTATQMFPSRIVASGTLQLSNGQTADLRLNVEDLSRLQMMGLVPIRA